MRLFGLILLLLISSPVVFGVCSGLDDSLPTYTINSSTEISCVSGEILDLHNSSSFGEITTLNIEGNLSFNAATLQVTDESSTLIHIKSGGSLVMDNFSQVSAFSGASSNEDVTILVDLGGSLEISGSILHNISEINVSSDSVIENSTIYGVGGLNIFSDFNSFNLNLSTSGISLSVYDGNYTFDSTYVLGEIYTENVNITFTDSILENRLVANDSILSLYNTTYDSFGTFSNSNLSQYWPVSVLVLNTLGFPLYGITVAAYDTFDSKSYEQKTFVDGLLEFDLLNMYYNGSFTYYSNYSINVTDETSVIYQPNSTSVNVTSPLSLNLSLETTKGIIKTGSNCDAARPFCTDVNPRSCLNMKGGDTCTVQFVVNGTDNYLPGSFLNGFYTFFMFMKGSAFPNSVLFSDNVSITFSE